MKMLRYNYNIDKWDLQTYDLIQQEKDLIACNKLLKIQKDQLYKDKYKEEEKEIIIKNDSKSVNSDESLESLVTTLDTTFNSKFNELKNELMKQISNLKEELSNSKDFKKLKLNHDSSVDLKKIGLIQKMFPESKNGDLFISSGFLRDFERLVRNCYYCELDDIYKAVDILSENYHINTMFECKRIFDRIMNIISDYKRLNNSADKGQYRNYHTQYELDKIKDMNVTQENKKIRYDLIELRREEYNRKKEEIANKFLDGVKEQKELVEMKLKLTQEKIKLKDLINNDNNQYLKNEIKKREKELVRTQNKIEKIKKNMDERINFNDKQRIFHEALNNIKVDAYRKADNENNKLYKRLYKFDDGSEKFDENLRKGITKDINKRLREVDNGIKINLVHEYKDIKDVIRDKNVSNREFKKMIKEGKFYTLNKNSYEWNKNYDEEGRCIKDKRSHAFKNRTYNYSNIDN